AATGETWLHSCGADVPVRSLMTIDDLVLALDADLLTRAGWDAVGEALDLGRTFALGHSAARGPDDLAHAVLDRIEALGLGPEVTDRLWLTPSCGLAKQTETDAVRALRTLRSAAAIITVTLLGEWHTPHCRPYTPPADEVYGRDCGVCGHGGHDRAGALCEGGHMVRVSERGAEVTAFQVMEVIKAAELRQASHGD